MQQAKKWYTSRTLWFNALSLVVIIASTLADPALVTNPQIVAGAGAVVTIANACLRLVTNSAIAGTPAAAAQSAQPTGETA